MELDKLLVRKYLPYAKSVIVERAIPNIDGFVPSGRRILYTADNKKLYGKKIKSSTLAGAVLEFHPHGDQTVYESALRMTDNNGSLNVPWLTGKGNFGKAWASYDGLKYASSRYTEMGLAPIAEEVLGDLSNHAVKFVPNFDDTNVEPELLPVRFPTILVNNTKGIAVGLSCSLPAFPLTNVCNATIGILNGTVKNTNDLMDILGCLEFSTGCTVNCSKKDLYNLGKTGEGTFTITSTYETYNDSIVFREIPYEAKIDKIVASIKNYMKEGEFKELSEVQNNIGIQGFNFTVTLKRGADVDTVLKKLFRLTDLRTKVSFKTRIIVDNRCKSMNLLELLQTWIDFRRECVKNMYQFKAEKQAKELHRIEGWQKVYPVLAEVVRVISNNNEADAKNILISKYGLDDEQAEYFLSMQIKYITKDRAQKFLTTYEEVRKTLEYYKAVVNDSNEQNKVIIADLERIAKKYGDKPKTLKGSVIKAEDEIIKETPISDEHVVVVMTKSGKLKRLVSLRDITNFSTTAEDPEVKRWTTPNNGHMLVFTRDGSVYKILVDSIDSSRGKMKESIADKLTGLRMSDVIYVDAAGDYSGHFNIVYANGSGRKVMYTRASGSRMRYKSLYEAFNPDTDYVTEADEFFILTSRRKAAYYNTERQYAILNDRTAFKACRITSNDRIVCIHPVSEVPDISLIDIGRYSKGYPVAIKEDKLW